jgi:hypothetical protein
MSETRKIAANRRKIRHSRPMWRASWKVCARRVCQRLERVLLLVACRLALSALGAQYASVKWRTMRGEASISLAKRSTIRASFVRSRQFGLLPRSHRQIALQASVKGTTGV